MDTINIFVTGGTFDKEYNEIKGTLYFRHSHLEEMLSLGRCRVPTEIRTLMMLDSMEMTDAHRTMVADACQNSDSNRIVVTHGTDTMTTTAAVIAERSLDKTIVLTGAMIPYKFGSSDGLFNMGSALSFVQVLEAGVYVAMNGRYYHWNKVRKNRSLGIFEEI